MCAVFLVPGRQPIHLRCLTGEWRDHRRHCEPEGLARSRNEVDQNFLRADSDDRNPFDLMNPIVDLSPSASERRIEPMGPNGLLSLCGQKPNRSKVATSSSPNPSGQKTKRSKIAMN
jgi:hypothetical protein